MILFVIPAFNEEANIARALDSFSAHCVERALAYRIIVVDDGSLDRTASIVREHEGRVPCELITYFPNRGVHVAFTRGFHRALELAGPTDVIVTTEADGTADLGILDELIRHIDDGGDVAIASYFADGGALDGTPWLRRSLSRLANLLVARTFQISTIRTFSSFFRAYRPSALHAVIVQHGDLFQARGFVCVVELVLRMSRLKMRIDEVPMVLRGAERIGKSKMPVLRTIHDYLSLITRHLLGKLRGGFGPRPGRYQEVPERAGLRSEPARDHDAEMMNRDSTSDRVSMLD